MGGVSTLIRQIQAQFSELELEDLIFHSKYTVDKHVVKKNNRPIFTRGRKPFIGKSDKLISQEKMLMWSFRCAASQLEVQSGYEGPVHAIYHFHFGPAESRSYKLTDLSNLFEIVSDSLEAAEVIKNDKQIQSFDGSRKYRSKTTFLEVFLLKFNEDTDLTHH